jgi:hypothetical protein
VTEPDCTCTHAARWHLKHALPRDGGVRLGRCLSKVKNHRGFPTACGCRVYKAKAQVTTPAGYHPLARNDPFQGQP